MVLLEKEKDALKKFANIIGVNWLDFGMDDYGDSCIINKEENKKMHLWQGLECLFKYNIDVCYEVIITPSEHTFFVKENGKIGMHSNYLNKEVMVTFAFENLIKRFPDVKKLNNLLTDEEKEICKRFHDEEKLQRVFSSERSLQLLDKAVSIIEEGNAGKEFIETEAYKNIGFLRYEYRLLLDYRKNKQK